MVDPVTAPGELAEGGPRPDPWAYRAEHDAALKRATPLSWTAAAQRVLACAAIQAITIALFAVGLWALNRGDEKVDRALAARGVVAEAIVVASEPSNHNFLQYRFTVEGRSYLSADFAATVHAEDYPVGSQVQIVYDRAAPATTCVCHPRANLRQYSPFSRLFLPVIWAAMIGPMISFQFGRWRGWWTFPSALYRRGV